MDITGSLLALLCIAPFAPFIWYAIKIESSGPALVRLERVSGNRIVRVYKFRTMATGAQRMRIGLARFNERNDGPFFKMRNDPRITRVGRFLRRFRLDEFPQLINVLTGELTLVGPRPHEPEEIAYYPEKYRTIVFATAGVTGLSQVNGASSLSFERELELDYYYLTHQSVFLDFKILIRTIAILFTDPTAV